MLTRSSTINAGWKCTRNSRATGTRGTHAIPFVPPHIRLGKKKIAVLDPVGSARKRAPTNKDRIKVRTRVSNRAPRPILRYPLSPPPFTFHFSLPSTFFSLSSFLRSSPLPSPLLFLQPPPFLLPFFLPLLSLSLSLSLSLHGKTVPPLSVRGQANRSKVGMANLRTVTNTIWAHLFFSSTVLPFDVSFDF